MPPGQPCPASVHSGSAVGHWHLPPLAGVGTPQLHIWLSSHQQSVWCCQFVKPVWNSQPWYTRSRIKKLHTQMRQTPRYPPLRASKGLMCVSVNRGRLVRLFIAMLSMLGKFGKSEFFVIFLKDQQKNYFNKNFCRCFAVKI